MSADVGRRGLLGRLVAREIAMRRAVVDVTTVVEVTTVVGGDNSVAAGNGIIGTQHHWQPLQRASDALLRLTARLGTLRCGRIEQRAASKALGRILRHGVSLLEREIRLKRNRAQGLLLNCGWVSKVRIQLGGKSSLTEQVVSKVSCVAVKLLRTPLLHN